VITITPGASISLNIFYDVFVRAATGGAPGEIDNASAQGRYRVEIERPDGIDILSAIGADYASASAVPVPAAAFLFSPLLAGLAATRRNRR